MKPSFLSPQDIKIDLPGIQLAAKTWGDPTKIPTIVLHGWLDNAASFDGIAPYLLDKLYLICLDLPGHGLSEHKPVSTYLHLIDMTIDIIHAAESLGLSRFALMGHSLGAALASLIAGTLQDRIISLILIDGLGGLTTEAEESPEQLRQFLSDLDDLPHKKAPVYTSIREAALSRVAVCPMKLDCAEHMLARSLQQTASGHWIWRSDPRLRLTPALQLTNAQTEAFLKAITTKTLLIRPDPGYPFDEKIMDWRIKAVKNLSLQRLPGSHHVHLDDPVNVAKIIQSFIK